MDAIAKEINFIPRRIKLERARKKRKLRNILFFIVLAVVVGLLVWIPFKVESNYLEKLKTIDQKLGVLNPGNSVYQEMTAKQEEYKRKKQAVELLQEKSSFKVLPFLELIAEIIPQGAFVSGIVIDADRGVDVTFVSSSPVDTAALIVGLTRLDLFKSVDIETVPFTGPPRPVEFKLHFNWAREETGGEQMEATEPEAEKGDFETAIENARKIKDILKPE